MHAVCFAVSKLHVVIALVELGKSYLQVLVQVLARVNVAISRADLA